MKRLVTLMLVVGIAMLPLSLTGCGQSADSAPAASSDSETPDADDTLPEETEEDSSSSTTSEGSGY